MDNIANMLTIIRNAQAVKKDMVSFPYSKFKMGLAEVLVKEGFAKDVSRRGKKTRKTINLTLKYDDSGAPAIERIARISKPSKRVYLPAKEIYPTRHGMGIRIFTTPKGILTNKEARKEKVGGELICEVR